MRSSPSSRASAGALLTSAFVTEQARETRSDALERLRLRTLSTFAYFTPEKLERGFRQLGEAVAADPGAPVPASQASLLTLERC
jgi:hypothetical protein